MQSFLLLEINEKIQEKKKEILLQKYAVTNFDQIAVITEKSIGIEDIRNLQKKLIFSPIQGKMKAAIIYHADSMTVDAQNAFLKTLEEPPSNTIIILLAPSKEKFLPTVLSRCFLIQDSISDKKSLQNLSNATTLSPHLSLGEKLHLAQEKGKTKETALMWLESEIILLREQMIKESNDNQSKLLRIFQNTHTLLSQTNVNARLAIEYLLLSI